MKSDPPEVPREPDPVPPRSGRDEMNLAEFPLALLTDRAPQGQKTLLYAHPHGRLIITGSDAFGLPTAADTDVLIGLVQLTRLRNNFTDPKVHFTRYELLRLLHWPDESKYYRRLDDSLNRWVGVTLHYDNTWWDNRSKRYMSAKLHILESVIVDDEKSRRRRRGGLPSSSFTWNKTFIESCQADNLKRLDLELYFGFRSAVTKRIFRFLDKRFYLRPEWIFDLKEFAFEHVGLSRNYASNAGKIKEKLQAALEELEGNGFLEPLTREERYGREGRDWTIRLVRRLDHPAEELAEDQEAEAQAVEVLAAEAQAVQARLVFEPDSPAVELPEAARELISRGVTQTTALKIVEQHPAEKISAKIEVFDWLVGRQDRRLRESPAGYLVKSIVDDYAIPKGFEPRAVRDRREEAERRERQRQAEEQRRRQAEQAREAADRARITSFWEAMGPAEQAQFEADALAQASEPLLASHRDTQGTPLEVLARRLIREAHIRKLLGLPDPPETP